MAEPAKTDAVPFTFTTVEGSAFCDFHHVSGRSPDKLMPETVGSGVVPLDIDMDGTLDLYFLTQNFLLEEGPHPRVNRVYRNLDGRFEDVTGPSGLGEAGTNHAAAVADFDNDGFRDLYVTRYGVNVLFINRGDGTFDRRSGERYAPHDYWSTGCAAFDGDDDGDLDLYIASYCELDVRNHPPCNKKPNEPPSYCMPRELTPGWHAYYENLGDLTFRDRTAESRIDRRDGRGFQVIAAQLNEDDHTDLYVANDVCPNFLFLGQGNGTFVDQSEVSGAAYDEKGEMGGSMGLSVEDINGDGTSELFTTNYAGQLNNLYINLGNSMFQDVTRRYGLGGRVLRMTGWGCGLVDFDNDGWPDLFVCNGHIDDYVPKETSTPYRQPAMAWWNQAGAGFVDLGEKAGPYFAEQHVGRGCTFADLDTDGDMDVILNNLDAPAVWLRNDTRNANRSVRLLCVGRVSNRDGVGARIQIDGASAPIHRQVLGGDSYLSCLPEYRTIGVGPATDLTVKVRWPSGREASVASAPGGLAVVE